MTNITSTLPRPALSAPINRLETLVFRVPLKTPRINSFGTMTHRTALIVRLIDNDGAEGWGECFCNWPSFAAEHRYRILTELIAPRLKDKKFTCPADLVNHLNAEFRILRIQADEPGPFDQSIAAVDIAAWDLAARKAGEPLYRVLGGQSDVASVPYYASGLSPNQANQIARKELEIGTRAFKSKVGWGAKEDLASLAALREVIGFDAVLMVDANQKWDLETARQIIPSFREFNLDWVEEPIPADHNSEDFAELASLGIPIAAGENVRSYDGFSSIMTTGKVSVIQPDIIKWGGITGCLMVAKDALRDNRRYCPHYLGGGIGLVATAHLLAAAGGDGLLELDATPNILRTLLAHPFPILSDGELRLPQEPGLGVAPNLSALTKFSCDI